MKRQLPDTPAFDDVDKLPRFDDFDATAFSLYITWILCDELTLFNKHSEKHDVPFCWRIMGQLWCICDRAQDKSFRFDLVAFMIRLARENEIYWPGIEALNYLSILPMINTSKDFIRLMGDIWMEYWQSGEYTWWRREPDRFSAIEKLPKVFQSMLLERMMPDKSGKSGRDATLQPEDYLTDFD